MQRLKFCLSAPIRSVASIAYGLPSLNRKVSRALGDPAQFSNRERAGSFGMDHSIVHQCVNHTKIYQSKIEEESS